MDGHIGYYAVFTMLALLEIISAAISLIVAVETMGIARKIKDKGLFRLGVGYAVMCIALVLGFTAALIALFYPVNPVLQLQEEPGHMAWHCPGGWRHSPWPGDRFGVSWNLVLLASIFFPISYAVILLGLSGEYVRFGQGREEKILGLAVAPGLIVGMASDMVSAGLLIGIIILARKGGGGVGPYIVFLASHLLRLVGEAVGTPLLFLAGEVLRPIALLIILARVMLG